MDIETNGIYLSDSLALLERIGPDVVTLAYVDPPTFPSNFHESKHKVDNEKSLEEHLSLVTIVLQQLQRILNHKGNLFFQSEHHLAGDYRQILDQVFGRDKFRSEIIWPNHRWNSSQSKVLRADHYAIFHYSKTSTPVYNQPFKQADPTFYTQRDKYGYYRLESLLLESHAVDPYLRFEWKGFTPSSGKTWRYSKEQLNKLDEEGRIHQQSYGQLPRLKAYLKESKVIVGTLWDDISPIYKRSKESLNFPTQRPLDLLNRIINIGSNLGDIILDPFCGVGTALVSAQLNGRKWLGCDISEEAYNAAVSRIEKECEILSGTDFLVGTQSSLEEIFPVVFETFNPLLKNIDRRSQPFKFVLGKPLAIDETRHIECKEIIGSKPLDIKDQAYEYAIAFLNSEGGQIYWGVRDSDKVVTGIKLSPTQRDKIRLIVSQKLHDIQPPVAPTEFRIELYQVYQDDRPIPELYVVHLIIPTIDHRGLYYTSSGKAYIRVDGLNKELKGPQLEAEILKRYAKAE